MTDNTYRVYMIKCKVTGELYIGRTQSTNTKYNPISVLYKRHKQDKTKYVRLGECITTHGYNNFAFTIIKKDLSDDESFTFMNECREKIKDKSLHEDEIIVEFDDELKLFNI